jgi:hypothetical protein
MSRYITAVLFIITCAATAQNVGGSPGSVSPLIWEPPTLEFPDKLPRPTVPKVMITTVRLGNVQIALEETTLNDAQTRLGGDMGQKGDASEALEWLCFYGTDTNGQWALWLESSEMGGATVDGFALQRLNRDAKADRRCRMLRQNDGRVELPVPLRLGMSEAQVRNLLGKPTAKYRNTVMFDHEDQETVRSEPFTTSNTVAVALRGGVVWAIQVWKTTSN